MTDNDEMDKKIINLDDYLGPEEAITFLQGRPTWKKVPKDEKQRLQELVKATAISRGGVRLGYILAKLWERKSSSYWQGKAKERARRSE